jgi:hypothetical protein
MELKSEIPIEAIIIGHIHVLLTLECGANPLNMTNATTPEHSSLTAEAARGGAPDNLTIIAIAIIATVIADVLHEGAGHGGACLLTGGRTLALSTVHFECDSEGRLVAAGGTIVNLIAGLIFWFASRRVTRSAHLRYFLWLSMTLNFFGAGGYFLFSGVGNIGDWAAVIDGFHPAWLWRIGLTLLGIGSYGLFMWVALLEMRPFLPRTGPERWKCAKKLSVLPYFADGILSCVAGLFNPVGMILVAISAAAASFGGASGLCWMWNWLKGSRIPTGTFEMPPLTRGRGWIIAAGILAALFVAVLGPGLKFHAGN